MKTLSLLLAVFASLPMAAQSSTSSNPDPFAPISFLEGTWDANVQNNSSVQRSGRYTFVRELNGHVLARHSTNDPNCKAPASFDCGHGDLLYVFRDGPASALKAIYFDNEGHIIHYNVSAVTPTSAVFLSEPGPGPRFRITYELAAGLMTGKFQMQMPGQRNWHTYLEWSGKND